MNPTTTTHTQAAHRYWHARYRPRRGWRKRQKAAAKRAAARARAAAAAASAAAEVVGVEGEGGVGEEGEDEQEEKEEEEEEQEAVVEGVVGGREGVPDPGTRRQAHRVAELDARLKVCWDGFGVWRLMVE